MSMRSHAVRVRRFRRVGAVLAVSSVLFVMLAPSSPSGASADAADAVQVVRHGGQDRYATSRLIADAFSEQSLVPPAAVVLVSGTQWTDAVVAAPLAGRLDAPVLLVPPDRLPDATLRWLADTGAERAIVVSTDRPGREPNLTSAVTRSLAAAGFVAQRVSGDDQYATSIAAARSAGEAGTLGATAVVASGEVFADALVAGPLAARHRLPLLLSPQAALDPRVGDYLDESGIDHVVLMGGTAALSARVQDEIEALGVAVSRIAGATRFETATLFAAYAARHAGGCFSGDEVGLARARVPFDALSAAPLLARRCAPVVLTDPTALPDATGEYLDDARRGRGQFTLRVFGGDAAVSQSVIERYLAADAQPDGGQPDGDLPADSQPDGGQPDGDLPADAARPAGAVYKSRSPRSVLPADDRHFIDHDEAAALFDGCEPAPTENEDALRLRQEMIGGYSRWDTGTTPLGPDGTGSIEIATGWWTQDRLEHHYGDMYPGIDVAWAKQNITVWPWFEIGFTTQRDYTPPPWRIEPAARPGEFPGLHSRLALDGFDGTSGAYNYVHHLGVHTERRVDPDDDAAWPADGGQLLWDWTGYMIQFAPIDREPPAWAMHTILSAYHPACVARTVLARCDTPFDAATSPHLRDDRHASALGVVLWSLVCGGSLRDS